MSINFKPLGDSAIFITFGDEISEEIHLSIKKFMKILEDHPFNGFIEMVPSYTNICIYYDVYQVNQWKFEGSSPYEKVVNYVKTLLQKEEIEFNETSRVIEIPVCYGDIYGPDLTEVATYNQLSEQEVIQIHTKNECLIYMLGFAPGFAFMGGMDEKIATPRKATPRLKIHAGSVGIAGKQTGIYPFETPGGWQIIGRTPLKLFLPDQNPPTLFRAGDRIRFVAISEQEFKNLAGEIK
ncbi:Inhibitor of KinA OS=Ureibacillus acetophenoni OX=614649 GN=SAMN05877842_11088 PE=4 SV=1 [Ureibacillus acetophenoni]